MDIQKLTKEQAVIISGFTGILCGEFSDFHADVEKRLGRGVQTFEFGFKGFAAEVKRLYEADFIEMGTVSKEKAKAQAMPEWISVKDNLPPENILVLGMSQTRSNIFNVYNVMALDEFEEAEVTHWMPLPDAPQEPAND